MVQKLRIKIIKEIEVSDHGEKRRSEVAQRLRKKLFEKSIIDQPKRIVSIPIVKSL